MKKNENVWKHFRKTEKKSATCKYCEFKYKSAILSRMAKHLLKCPKSPPICKQQLKITSTSQNLPASADGEMLVQSNSKKKKIRPKTQLNLTVENSSTVNVPNVNKDLNLLLAKAIYVSGTPLSIVEHPLWIKVFNELQPSYKLPTRKTISTTILDKTYREMFDELKEDIMSQPSLHLMISGWSNSRNDGNINILIAKPEPIFIKSIAIADNRYTSDYICKEILKVLTEYGAHKFATIMGHNAQNMQSAFRLVKDVNPDITCLNCAAHTLNFLCKSIIELLTCKENIVSIIRSIKNSSVLSSLLAKIIKETNAGETLKLPYDIRWCSYSYYSSFKSVQSTKVALQTLAVHKDTTMREAIKIDLLDDEFWDDLGQCTLIMKPIADAIILLQENENIIHKVFITLKNIKSNLVCNVPGLTVIEDCEKYRFLEKVVRRIDMCLKPIHLAAYLLDPTVQGSELDENQEIDAMEFIHKLGQSMDLNVMENLASYKARDGFWGKRFLWENIGDISPLTWWKGICASTALSKVAVRILTAPCTVAAAERSVSAYSNEHSKKSYRLTADRAAKLTFIAYNWKILHKNDDCDTGDCMSDSPTPTETTPLCISPEPMNF